MPDRVERDENQQTNVGQTFLGVFLGVRLCSFDLLGVHCKRKIFKSKVSKGCPRFRSAIFIA